MCKKEWRQAEMLSEKEQMELFLYFKEFWTEQKRERIQELKDLIKEKDEAINKLSVGGIENSPCTCYLGDFVKKGLPVPEERPCELIQCNACDETVGIVHRNAKQCPECDHRCTDDEPGKWYIELPELNICKGTGKVPHGLKSWGNWLPYLKLKKERAKMRTEIETTVKNLAGLEPVAQNLALAIAEAERAKLCRKCKSKRKHDPNCELCKKCTLKRTTLSRDVLYRLHCANEDCGYTRANHTVVACEECQCTEWNW